jgi:nucleoside-diphosphate-sugar epimerase
MRIFVSGASGHIGSALLPELISTGHQVVGLARSDAPAEKIAAMGAEVRRGDLDDTDGLRAAASAADGVIHLAFRHDLMQAGDRDGAASADLGAINAFAEALAGTGKPLVGTSGILLLAFAHPGQVGTEEDVVHGGFRIESENLVIGLADRGVRSSVVRLPPTVHSGLDTTGYIPTLIGIARDRGFAAYVGDGTNRWPAVHTLDAAHLYRLALENAVGGTRLHAVGDEGIPFTQIAGTIASNLGVPVRSLEPGGADDYFGFLGPVVQLDSPASSERTQELLGWKPNHPGLIEDMNQGHYFRRASSSPA